MTAVLDRPITATPCELCAESVVHRFTKGQRHVVLDAERVPAGLFAIDEYGRAVRRPLHDYVRESAGHGGPGGYQEHECTGRARDWFDV